METVAVALAGLGLFALYAWAGRYWVDLVDEGYFLYLASRVHGGDLPYRDFDTYYTPGVFYLYAATFELFGVSIVPVRVLMAGMRAVCAVLLYGLTRRVAPWPFAVLPFLAIALVDPMPVFPEPHPAWSAVVATLLVMEALARHQATQHARWIVLAGAAAGLAFLFKQNVGAFAALAVGGYVVLRDREPAGRVVLATRALFATGLVLAATLFLWPGLDTLVGSTIWLPLPTTLGLLLWTGWPRRTVGWTAGVRDVVVEGAGAGAAFVGVTLLWLVPLTLALGPRETPFGLFVGAVNQGALLLRLEPPPRAARELALAAIWVPLGLAALAQVAGGGWRLAGGGSSAYRRLLALVAAVVVTLLLPFLPTISGPREAWVEEPALYPWLGTLDAWFSTLYVYLPALGAWTGLLVWASGSGDRLTGSGRFGPLTPDARRPTPVPWYLLVGTLAALAMYPRVDTLHAMFAGPPLFVVGAWALSRLHQALAGRADAVLQAAVFAALLIVPAAAVAPHAYWRYVTLAHPDPRAAEPPPYVPLGLERAPVLAPKNVADNLRGAVDFVRAGTPPGAPFFAYPVVPLFNFLADRPNPTRFDHFLPGALTPEDMAETVARLEAAKPRYVLWDHGGVVYWGTDAPNRPLSDYIWRCYAQAANFPPFLILERRDC